MNDEARTTALERRAGRRYLREFGAGIVLFLGLFLLLPYWWETQPGTASHLIRTLLPVLPLVGAIAALWRHLRRIDEMHRIVLVRSFAFGFAITMFATLVVALVRGSGIDVPGAEWIIFIVGMTGWSLAIPVNAMRGT